MNKRIIILLFIGFISSVTFAQQSDLMVQGVTPNLHLVHTVSPKENWYSVGRLYNISPKEIAPYNGVNMEMPLSIGQKLKIPLTASNFSQNGSKVADEVFVPVYHVVQDKEWMYRISTNYNKVPVENIEKWNHISKDQAKAGTRLIVGYLKVKQDQSALASKAASVNTPAEPVAKAEEVKPAPAPKPESRETAPPVAVEEKKKAETPPVTPVENKPVVTKTNPPAAGNPGSSSGGYFRSLFAETGKTASGASGVFKSTSGWQDGKYYALMNNVSVGTVIQVSNPGSNRIVYAKVLGQLPDMKDSNGLALRLSDAAASQLGVNAGKFPVEIKY